MNVLNKICFTICLICTIVAIGLALSMIWLSHSSEFIWKSLATCGVVFLGSSSLAAVGRMFNNDRGGR
jgi:hypothetical protein